MTPRNKILVAVPTRGKVHWNLVARLLQLQEASPTTVFHLEPGSLSVSDVRNRIVQVFLATQCEVLIQIDDDVLPRMNVLELADSSYDIVGATYFIARSEMNLPFPCAFRWNGEQKHYYPMEQPFGRSGVVECAAVATGCMAIKRHVLAHPEMRAPFAMKYTDDGVIDYSDDIHFCHRARALGFSIAADFDRHADHVSEVSLNKLHYGYADAYGAARRREQQKPVIILPGEPVSV